MVLVSSAWSCPPVLPRRTVRSPNRFCQEVQGALRFLAGGAEAGWFVAVAGKVGTVVGKSRVAVMDAHLSLSWKGSGRWLGRTG